MTPDAPQRTELDGIPTFWARGPRYAGALAFRGGWADETLATHGITHLTEHLALSAMPNTVCHTGGSVDEWACVFYAEGEPQEVAEFLVALAATLGDLPLERLEVERRVLRVEAAERTPSQAWPMLLGSAGLGLNGYEEIGLRWLGAEQVCDHARALFRRGNAVLWFTGEPPGELPLGLPGGGSPSAPVVSGPLPRPWPLQAWADEGVLAASLCERSMALVLAAAILEERLFDSVRRQQGLSYSPFGRTQTVAPSHATFEAGTACELRSAGEVRAAVWRALTELAERGPTAEELDRHRTRLMRAWRDPEGVAGILDSQAHHYLWGEEGIVLKSQVAELAAVEGRHVSAALEKALAATILISPVQNEAPDPLPRIDGAIPKGLPRGRRFVASADAKKHGRGNDELWIDLNTVTLLWGEGESLTLRWAEMAAAERLPAGTGIQLSARDGWLIFSIQNFEDGAEALRLVERSVPSRAWVPYAPTAVVAEIERAATALDEPFEWGSELHLLAKLMTDGERIVELLPAHWNGLPGMVAVTDQRILWINGAEEPETNEWVLAEHAIEHLSSRRTLRGKRRVRAVTSRGVFDFVLSGDDGARLLAALEAADA